MANTTQNLVRDMGGDAGGPFLTSLPVKAATHIYEGALISQTSSGYALPYSASGAGVCVGVAMHEIDNSQSGATDGGVRVQVQWKRVFNYTNGTSGDAFADTSLIGSLVYATDDHTVAATSNSAARKAVGFFMGFEADGTVRVLIDPTLARIIDALQTLTDSPATADALRDNIVASFG